MSRRIEWIDIAKGIGMVTVVFGHTNLPAQANQWIWSFHMPLFFFLSGLLFSMGRHKSYGDFIVKKSKALALPFLYFSLIVLGLYMFLPIDVSRTEFVKNVITNGWGGIALWFIPVLFFSEILFYPLQQYTNRILLVVALIAISLIGFYLYTINFHFPYALEVVFIALFFYGCGYLFSGIAQEGFGRLSATMRVIVLLFFITVNLVFCFANGSQIDLANNILNNYFYTIIAALAGTGFIIFIAKFIEQRQSVVKKILLYIGTNTLIILAMHQVTMKYLIFIFKHFQGNTLVLTVIKHAGYWTILFVLIETINNYLPFLLGRKKKRLSIKQDLLNNNEKDKQLLVK